MEQPYIDNWPKFAPEWCENQIKKAEAKLADKAAPPSTVEAKKLEQRVTTLKRIKADFEAMGYS
jgi:hypothetical protein